MLIPKGGNVYTASVYMNYYYTPAVAAKVEDYVNYICPVKGAREAITKLPGVDPALADDPLIFPADDANAKVFRSLEPDEETKYTEDFQKVLGV
jgi:spermidine/putrescine transport system substrate-binding protein